MSTNAEHEGSQKIKVKHEETESNNDKDDDNASLSNDDNEEEFYRPPEPDYTKANSLPFQTLCRRMENVWALKKKKKNNQKKVSKNEILSYLLPKTLIQFLGDGSVYPVLRLLVPDKDTVRPHFGIKEKVIARVWGEALGEFS